MPLHLARAIIQEHLHKGIKLEFKENDGSVGILIGLPRVTSGHNSTRNRYQEIL